MAVGIEDQIPIAIVATGSPEIFSERHKESGAFVMHAVASVKHARKANACGVDAVVADGFEGGGHSGYDELTMSVLAQVVDAVKIPLIAAGGIADGRGLVAALALGAQAVYWGTRFMATHECRIHPAVKAAFVNAPKWRKFRPAFHRVAGLKHRDLDEGEIYIGTGVGCARPAQSTGNFRQA